MSPFIFLINWMKKAVHIQPNALKHAPGIHDPQAAAAAINALTSSAIDAEAAKHGVTVAPNDTTPGA